MITIYSTHLGSVLGEGSFGTVFASDHYSPACLQIVEGSEEAKDEVTGQALAIKVYNQHTKILYNETILNELEMCTYLKELNLSGVVNFHTIATEEDKEMIVMEQLKGGDLLDYISNQAGLTESEASFLFQSMVKTVKGMHDNNLIHCDLKSENFVFCDKAHTEIKLVDFGASIRLTDSVSCADGIRSSKNRGTLLQQAPELLEIQETSIYSAKSDVWALGVILCNMLTNTFPFQKKTFVKTVSSPTYIAKLLKQVDVYRNLSSQAKDLITHILDANKETRYTTEDILNHAWFKSHPMK